MRGQFAKVIEQRRCIAALRRLAIGLAICIFSAQVHALGLGKLRVNSALDEPLRAEIELTSVAAGDLEGLQATLGTREDFARAGVQRPAYLQALQFSIDGASSAIVVSTKQPAKEPFIHFVIAVEWAGGKLVREYTALLDPPLYAKEQPAAISSPSLVDTTSPAQSISPPPPPLAVPETSSGAVTTGDEVRTGEYGPTVEGDTLWSIASRLDTSGTNISIFQVLLALQRENPDAFINNNINLLKTGQTLRIGNIESIGQIPKQEAIVAYQAQLATWQAQGGVASTAATEVAMPSEKPSASAAPSAPTQAAGTQKEKDVLRIVQATLDKDKSKSAGAGNAAEVQSLKDQITTLEDSLASRELENKELRERVTLLEEQVENAKRLMEIESAGLAMAQKQAADAEAKIKEAEAAAKENEEKPQESAGQTVAAAPPPAPKPKDIKAPPPAPKPQAAKTEAKPKPKPQKASPQRASSTFRKPEKSWWQSTLDNLLGGDLLFTGAIIAALILIAIGGILFVRRRRSIAEFEESILTGTALDGHTDTTESADAGGGDTSFLSDFGLGGMGSVQADEVDPLAEAEVYLAYGRDEQAEEVLREATTRNPERHELKLKLLEIYQQRNDVKSFETLAEELYPASGSGDVTVWRKVVDMGRKVSPENPLFSQEVPVVASDDSTTTTTTTTTLTGRTEDELFSPSEPSATDDFPAPDSTLELDQQLDRVSGLQQSVAEEVRDASTTAENKAAKTATQEFPAPAPPELDFDLDLDELGTGSTEQQAVAATTDTAETTAETEADIGLDTLDDMSDLDFDLGDDLQSPKPGAPDSTAVHAVASTDTAEITGFDLVDAENLQTDKEEAGGDGESQEQWDDAATKLDLAKAYMDMGDKAGARSIIDEVLKEGNPAQRQQAGELAAQL